MAYICGFCGYYSFLRFDVPILLTSLYIVFIYFCSIIERHAQFIHIIFNGDFLKNSYRLECKIFYCFSCYFNFFLFFFLFLFFISLIPLIFCLLINVVAQGNNGQNAVIFTACDSETSTGMSNKCGGLERCKYMRYYEYVLVVKV